MSQMVIYYPNQDFIWTKEMDRMNMVKTNPGRNTIRCFFLTLLIMALPVFLLPARQAVAAQETLEELVDTAWANNSSLEALTSAMDAAANRVTSSKAWMDPALSLEYSNVPLDTFAFGDHPMTGIQIRLQQTVPLPGKIKRRYLAEEAAAKIPDLELAERRNQIRLQIKRAYWELALHRQLKEIAFRHFQQTEQLIENLGSRYETGSLARHDLLRLQVFSGRLKDDLADHEAKAAELEAFINALLSRSVNTPVATPASIDPVAFNQNQDDLISSAQDLHPQLALWEKRAEIEKLLAKRAAYEGLPDPTFWVAYRIREEVIGPGGVVMDEGTDFVSAGVSVPLPIFYKNRNLAEKKEHLAGERQAKSTRGFLIDQLQGELASAISGWNRAYEKAVSYEKELLPTQRAALEAVQSAYRVSRADFTSLYEAKTVLLDLERVQVQAQIRTKQFEAVVESLVGKDLSHEEKQP